MSYQRKQKKFSGQVLNQNLSNARDLDLAHRPKNLDTKMTLVSVANLGGKRKKIFAPGKVDTATGKTRVSSTVENHLRKLLQVNGRPACAALGK